MTVIAPLRFLRVVPLHSPYMLLALAAVGLSSMAMIALDPTMGEDAIAPVALLQMFAASSGFAVPARRGHFDLLLTGGATRLRIAAAHLAVSVLPGVALWLVLGLAGMAAARTIAPRAFAPGTVFAMLVISVLAWAVTVPLPRLSGGIAWLLLIALALVGWLEWRALVTAAGTGTLDPVTLAAMYLVCPLLLVGQRLTSMQAAALVPGAVIAAAACAAAIWWITRMDVALESAQ
jgi:hypothetical protein